MAIGERTQQDLPACIRLLEVVHRLRRYPVTWPEDPQDWLCPQPTDVAWVAVEADDVVGHVCLTSPAHPGTDLALERLFVSPAHEERGVGRALLAQAVDWSRAQDRRLTLEVADNCERAIRVYTRLGWHAGPRTPVAWGGDEVMSVVRFDAP